MVELYKEEIFELTQLLRNDEDWGELRCILTQKGFVLSHIALVEFMEDQEENEYGVIVTKDMKVSEYWRLTKDNNIHSFIFKDITNDSGKINKYPQIYVAINMIKNGEIL